MVKIMTKRAISHSFHAVFIKGHSSGHRLFTCNVSGICVAFLESVCSSITLWSSSMPLVLILSPAMICSAGVWQKLEEQTGAEVQALKVQQVKRRGVKGAHEFPHWEKCWAGLSSITHLCTSSCLTRSSSAVSILWDASLLRKTSGIPKSTMPYVHTFSGLSLVSNQASLKKQSEFNSSLFLNFV